MAEKRYKVKFYFRDGTSQSIEIAIPSGYTPEKGKDYFTEEDKAELVRYVVDYMADNLPSGGVNFETDESLILKDEILSVNTTDVMEQNNTLPITSAGVYAVVGNIEVLLKTI